MTVDPMKSGSMPAADATRLGHAHGAQAARDTASTRAEEAKEGARDSVELSEESRRIAGGTPAGTASGLSAERLRTVLDRVQGGFYDRPEVLDTIGQRARKDLGLE